MSDTTTAKQGGGKGKQPFVAFTSNPESAAQLQQFAASKGWPADVIHSGDIDTAAEYLKTSPSPEVLMVDVPTAEGAAASFDKLADVCEPGVKVIASGKVNEYSFYCWLVEMGISSYLLQPLTVQALEGAYKKATDVPAPAGAAPAAAAEVVKGKVIAVVGARGGVGASTVALNLAWLLSHQFQQKTALLDLDPQLGTAALSLDVEPGKGLRDVLQKPERIDSLFLDRVMVRLDETLSILSTEEGIEEQIDTHEQAAVALYKQTRTKYDYIVVDVPRWLNPYTRNALANADQVICVTELSLLALRESVRYLEYIRDSLKVPAPMFVANRVGVAGKNQMPQGEFEKGLGAKVDFSIPLALEAHAASTAGQVLVEAAKNSPAVKALQALATSFVPGSDQQATQKSGGRFSFLKKG